MFVEALFEGPVLVCHVITGLGFIHEGLGTSHNSTWAVQRPQIQRTPKTRCRSNSWLQPPLVQPRFRHEVTSAGQQPRRLRGESARPVAFRMASSQRSDATSNEQTAGDCVGEGVRPPEKWNWDRATLGDLHLICIFTLRIWRAGWERRHN